METLPSLNAYMYSKNEDEFLYILENWLPKIQFIYQPDNIHNLEYILI